MVLIVIGVVWWAVDSANDAMEEHYVAPHRVEWEKKLAAEELVTSGEKARAEAAEKANIDLYNSINGVSDKVAACNARVDDVVHQQNLQILAGAAARKEIMDKWAKDQDRVKDNEARAMGPPTPGDFCEQARKADETLSDIARRQRLRHPAGQEAAGK